MLLSLSLNAKRAPLEVREPFAFQPEELPEIGSFLRPHVAEVFLLCTCQRFEVYAIPRVGLSVEALADLLASYRRVDAVRLRAHLQMHQDREAVGHLFRVTAGLESPVVGEAQILGQVRRALETNRTADLLGHRLGSLIQHAVVASRRVRVETALGRGALSVPRVVVEHARREIGDLSSRTALLVGAGETARLAAKALEGVGRLIVVNRTLARAKALASQTQGEVLPWAALPKAVSAADLIICCTGGQQPTVSQEMVAAAQQARGERPLLLIDLAVPRAVESGAAELPGVRLVTLEFLRERCTASHAERLKEVPKAEVILAEEAERAWRAWEGAGAHQAIAALRQRADEVRRAELERSLRRLRNLPPELGEMVEAMTQAIVNKLLHQPTSWLKANPALADAAVQDFFGVKGMS